MQLAAIPYWLIVGGVGSLGLAIIVTAAFAGISGTSTRNRADALIGTLLLLALCFGGYWYEITRM
jgi:hypothetical protein